MEAKNTDLESSTYGGYLSADGGEHLRTSKGREEVHGLSADAFQLAVRKKRSFSKRDGEVPREIFRPGYSEISVQEDFKKQRMNNWVKRWEVPGNEA